MKKAKIKSSTAPCETKAARRKMEEPPTTPPCIFDSIPEEICHHILSRMPMRDAVRTSVLSKAWGARWRDATALIFDESCIPRFTSIDNPSSYYTQLAAKYVRASGGGRIHTRGFRTAVKRWLMQRSNLLLDQIATEDILIGVTEQLQGPLEMLRLSLPDRLLLKDLIEKLYHSAVRELVLEGCILQLPPELCSGRRGFLELADLTLKGVVITAGDLGSLISSCPSLSRLTLDIKDIECVPGTHFTTLVMSAPHLKHLEMRLGGLVWCIRLIAPQLVSAWISLEMFNGVRMHTPLPDGGCNLNHLLGESPRLAKLTITSLSLQFLCVGTIPSCLRQPLNNLEWLDLTLNFNSPFHANGAVCLFTSSPTLKHLHLDNWSSGISSTDLASQQSKANIWDTVGECCSFPRLEHLVINGLSGMDSEIAFLRFVLRRAPVLTVLDIKKPRIISSRLCIASLRHLVLHGLQDLLALRGGMTRVTIY